MSEKTHLTYPYLLSAEDLTLSDIKLIFEKARFFLNNFNSTEKFTDLKGVTIALAFFEPSTRTKLSFELAAKRLSAEVLSFQSASSSLTKGESLLDTLKTMEALGVQIYVVRHSSSGVPIFLQKNTCGIVINAGDGKHQHPTQALLDAFTLMQHFGSLENLKVCIIGDIIHSRVARSNISLLKTLGAQISICGPGTLIPNIPYREITYISNINEAIEWADVLLVLRLQRERMDSGLLPSLKEYSTYYQITFKHLTHKPELILLHPGPVNYGIELDYKISSFPNVLIQNQVTYGVFIRMAVLSLLVGQRFGKS